MTWLVVLTICIPGLPTQTLQQDCPDWACVAQLEYAYREFPEITGIAVSAPGPDHQYLGFYHFGPYEKNERKA